MVCVPPLVAVAKLMLPSFEVAFSVVATVSVVQSMSPPVGVGVALPVVNVADRWS